MAGSFLGDLVLLLVVSITVVVLLRRLRLPPLAGFLVVGVALGPHALGWVRAVEEVEALAEIGVALLLFTVGLEFSIPRVLLLRRALVIGGGGQILLTILAVWGAGLALGAPSRIALLFAFLAALSSTALVLKSLADEHSVDSPHGRFSVAVLLSQDLAIIPLLLLIPVLAGGAGGGAGALGLAVGKAVLGVVLVLVFARYGFSRLATRVVRAGGRELFTLFIVLVALGAAWITHVLALPLALGAFVAGLVISESEYSHQVVDEILPFRDVFSALFFVSVGMLLDVSILVSDPLRTLGLGAGLALIKGIVVFGLALWLTRSARVALLAATALFQVGEFSFVLARQASDLGLLGSDQEQLFLAVAVLTMLVTPFAMRGGNALAGRFFRGERSDAGPAREREAQVLVAGFGMTGRHLARVLAATGLSHEVIELDPERARAGQRVGVPVVLGDASRADTLAHAGLASCRVFVVAIDDPAASRRAVALARRLAPSVQIVVRTRFLEDTEELLRLGASQVVPEDFETSLEIFGRVLRELHVPRGAIAVQTELIRREGYQLLRAPVTEERHLEVLREVLANTAADTVFVASGSPAAGRTLGELEVRARTGVTVLSVVREGKELHSPGADLRLEPNDLLVALGNHQQLDRVRDLVAGTLADWPTD